VTVNVESEARSRQGPRPPARGTFTVGLIAGLLFLSFGLWQVVGSWRAAVTWPKADGGVVKNVLKPTSGYVPVVRSVTAEGEKHRFTDAVGASVAKYAVGERVRVAYDADDPTSARIVSPLWRLWLAPGVFTFLGLVLVVGCGTRLVFISRSV
jgi:hypothetical protein